MGLALITEATGALLVGWRHRTPPLGEDVGCLPDWVLEAWAKKWTQPLCSKESAWKRKRERERKRKKDRDQSSGEVGSAALFSKGAFIPWVTHFQKWKIQSHAESAQHYISLTFIGTRMFSAYLFIYKGLCVMYIIFWPCGLPTFYDSFLIKVGQPENLFSLKVFFFIHPIY